MSSTRRPRRTRGPAGIAAGQRISGPAEILSAVPYLLGFHPRRSLVLVGVADGRLAVTARMDLIDAAQPGFVHDTLVAMARGGARAVVAAVFEPDEQDPCVPVLDTLMAAADAIRCSVDDVLVVMQGRWKSLRCEDRTCCPPDGNPLSELTTPFAVAATVAGVAPVTDRAALAATLAPYEVAGDDPVTELIAVAERAQRQATPPAERTRHDAVTVRAIIRRARESQAPGWAGVDDADAARFGVALTCAEMRDEVWLRIEDRRIDGRDLWQELGRRLPDPYAAAPMFLFGWASWRAGEGALASIAVERALHSDPGYSAAAMLATVLAHGVDPRQFPRLHLPTSA